MVKKNYGLLRVFWPSNLVRPNASGVIVGWRNSDSDLFVVTVLEDVDVRSVENALRTGTLFRGSPYPIFRIFQLCDRPAMSVLGTLNQPHTGDDLDLARLQVYQLPRDNKPRIFCPAEADITTQFVIYDAPDPAQLEYVSLDPINLALGDGKKKRHTAAERTEDDTEDEKEEEEERKRVKQLVEKLRFHTVIRHKATHKELALLTILRQINCTHELDALLQKNISLVGLRRKRDMSVSERVVESAQSLYAFAAWSLWTVFMTYVYPGISSAFKLAIIGHRLVAEGVLCCLEFQLPIRRLSVPDSVSNNHDKLSLMDVSACCQQVHLRLQQFSYYPTQYTLLRRRYATWSSIAGTNSDYIRFYNSLWLVANDVILGIALGSFINENAAATSHFIATVLDEYTIEGLKRMIRWLMSYPGGLKLNTELAAFLGDLFLWVIEYWALTTQLCIRPYLPTLVYFIGFSSFAGASMPVAVFSDLVSLLTLHIYSFYVASARIFNWQLTIIISLFHLFRGKKRNVLRNRIDSCDYDLDQLLLGTILFTLLFFLLPTVIVFYLTFASARMAIISLKATLDTCLAFLNHFPLFALMLRIKDSKRLPGGVHFELLIENVPQPVTAKAKERHRRDTFTGHETGEEGEEEEEEQQHEQQDEGEEREVSLSQTAYIKLASTPLSMRQIFAQYFQLGARIRKHYLSAKVVLRLLSGRFVPPLGRGEMYGMQYSVLPRERVSIGEVWKGLFEEEQGARSGASSQDGGSLVPGLVDEWDSFTFGTGKKWK